MKLVLLPCLFLCSCSAMSPSTKIFEVHRTTDSKGNPKAASFKVFDSQADFYGDTVIQTRYVAVRAASGINHSTAIREHWSGATAFGRAIVQPIVWGVVTGGVLGGAVGQGASAARALAR